MLAFIIAIMFSIAEKVHAQFPAGVTFDGYRIEKLASQTAPIPGGVPQYWAAEQGSPDIDNMDSTFRNIASLSWRNTPSTLFDNTVTYIICGGYDSSNGFTRAESFSTSISGLTVNSTYIYSFVATGNNLSTRNSSSLTLGIYFNGTLVASKAISTGVTASRHSFSFVAPATSGTLSIGIVSVVGGVSGESPWYQIAGGSGEFVASCNVGSTAPPLSGTTLSNTCPATTANLNNLHTGTAPGTSQLVWFTNNNHTGAAYATPTAATPGTYYAYYYDYNNGGCYSPVSSAVTVTTTNCCAAGTTAPVLSSPTK